MKAIEQATGMTRVELEKYYLEKVIVAMRMGFSALEAREIVRETMLKSLGLKA
jgi:hypothetical protein